MRGRLFFAADCPARSSASAQKIFFFYKKKKKKKKKKKRRGSTSHGAVVRPRPRRVAPSITAATASSAVAAGPGRTRTKLDPAPGSWRPPARRPSPGARSRAIGRPSPVPVTRRARPSGRSVRRSAPGRRPRSPGPSSRTAIEPIGSVEPAGQLDRPPSRANFRALAARFVTICSTPRRSPVAAAVRAAASARRSIPRSIAIGSRPSDHAQGLGDRERPISSAACRIEAGRTQQVADEVGHRVDDVAAALHELALDRRILDAALEDQVEIAGQAGQRRPQSWATVDTNRRAPPREPEARRARRSARAGRSPGRGPRRHDGRGSAEPVGRAGRVPGAREDEARASPRPADRDRQRASRRRRRWRSVGRSGPPARRRARPPRDRDRRGAARPRAAAATAGPPRRARHRGRGPRPVSSAPRRRDGHAPVRRRPTGRPPAGRRRCRASEIEQAGEAVLGARVGGEDVEGARQHRRLLVRRGGRRARRDCGRRSTNGGGAWTSGAATGRAGIGSVIGASIVAGTVHPATPPGGAVTGAGSTGADDDRASGRPALRPGGRASAGRRR